MKKILLIILLTSAVLNAQNDPAKLINRVRDKFKKVHDYQVDANIKVDVDFIKVPEMTAKILFKQPDKVKLNTEGFAMVPKQAFNFSPERLFKDKYTAVFVRTDKLNNVPVSVIKVIPDDENSDVAISTLWIDSEKDVIRKIESIGKKGGSFDIEFDYDKATVYPLPSFIKFSFIMPKPNVPGGSRNDAQKGNENGAANKKTGKGAVTISYKNYQINKGIPDSMFAEKDNKKH